MSKVKVTVEEKLALDAYIETGNLHRNISHYINNCHTFGAGFRPLREMGLEKFIKCVLNGYELKFDDEIIHFIGDKIELKYNAHGVFLSTVKNPIYLKAKDGSSKVFLGLTISEAKKLVGDLTTLLYDLKRVRDDV